MWLWDSGRARIVWSNFSALEYWGEQSAADLSLRDMGQDGPLARAVITGFENISQGKRIRKTLVLTPKSEPLRSVLDLAPYPVPGFPNAVLMVVSATPSSMKDEERLERLFENIPAPLTLFASDGTAIQQNNAADALFGSLTEHDGHSQFSDRMTQSDHARMLYTTALTSASAGRVSSIITAQGTERMRVQLRRFTDPVSAEITLLAMYQDMPSPLAGASRSDRPDALATTSEPDRTATVNLQGAVMETLEAAGVGLVTIGQAGNILSFSQGATAILGIEGADAKDQNFAAYLSDASGRQLEDFLTQSPSDDAIDFTQGAELTGLNQHNKELALQVHIRPVSGQGDAKYCIVIRDISDWTTTLQQLDLVRSPPKVSNTPSPQVLAYVSHEIRTPLNAILGFTELMQLETFGPVGNEKYKEYLNDIKESGTHVLSLVNDLLDLSKTEAGHMDLDLQPLDVGRIVASSERFVGPQVLSSRITLESHIDINLPTLNADRRALRQILVNLLSNAVRATPKGGTVSTHAHLDNQGNMIIEVRDNGSGMTEDQIKIALQPYGQLGNETMKKEGGTGLGLPLAKALTKAHGAQLSITSEPGKGTSVKLTFPMTA